MLGPRSSLLAAILIIGALLAGCLTAGPGACGSEDREFFSAIDHFEGLPLDAKDHPYGVCAAIFTTAAPADDVIAHYGAEFEAAGWRVAGPDVMADAAEPGVTRLITVSAYRDTYQYHVSVSAMADGTADVNVMAGNAEQ
jgi:hypothetical protein